MTRARLPSVLLALGVLLSAAPALAQTAAPRSVRQLPSSNGRTAILADMEGAKLTHFRESLFATEEPLLDASGDEVWAGNQPQVVKTRDLLYDAYFGLRSGGTQRWLNTVPVLASESGYEEGTGIIRIVQRVGDLEVTTSAFAPQDVPAAAFVFIVRLRNVGSQAVTGVSLFSLQNFHLGFGRPGVTEDLGENGETVIVHPAGGTVEIEERGFAGVVLTRALGGAPTRQSAWNLGSPAEQNGWQLVNGGGTADLPNVSGGLGVADGWAHAFQWDVGTLAPNAEVHAGIAVAHHGDPFAVAQLRPVLEPFSSVTPLEVVVAERARWSALQAAVRVPTGVSNEEAALVHQSAAVLAMSQVKGDTVYLREWLTRDGEPRFTRFPAANASQSEPATLPAVVRHRGEGAVLASLPPGEWTYAWIRDGAYAVAALGELGMFDEAEAGLEFYLRAEAGRFQHWDELKPYGMPPYQITLTRYHGFGVEETDFNDFGPNLEFDGFGLFLWSLRQVERAEEAAAGTAPGPNALAQREWQVISERIADPIVALIDPQTGLLRADSSIWETHWLGRQRHWTYTNLTAVRGLCDAAEIAERVGDTMRAARYRETAESLRRAMALRLTDANGALASNLEELQSGRGYWDAAVLDAIAFGLFDPQGRIARATLDGIEASLRVQRGAGWARNDDRTDHAGAQDLSPWGGEYDSAEWLITNLRGAVALRRAGRTERADAILDWVRRQSAANFLTVAETYDEQSGAYKFNAPMAGFGAGAWVLALTDREGRGVPPACGAYFDESTLPDAGIDGGVLRPDAGSTDAGAGDGGPGDGGTGEGRDGGGCSCASGTGASLLLGLLLAVGFLTSRREATRTRA